MALPKSREAKKVNLDFNKEFINTFTQNIESKNVEFINQTLKDLHEADGGPRGSRRIRRTSGGERLGILRV